MSSSFPSIVSAMLLSVGLLAASACGDSGPTTSGSTTAIPAAETFSKAPVSRPLSTNASILGSNSLIARITGSLESESHVYVEYWAETAGRLRSGPVPSDGTEYTVYAVRLRPNTRYEYRVFGTDLEGTILGGPRGTFTTGELPGTLRKATFDVLKGKPTHDLTFMEFEQPGFSGLAAIDGSGRVVWYYESPAPDQHPRVMARKPNGNIVFANYEFAGARPRTSHGLVEITPLGEVVDSLVGGCPPDGPIHHEVQVLPDGRIMYLSKYVLRPALGDPPVPQEADTVGIWDQATGENRIVWNVADFLSPSDRTVPESNADPPPKLWEGCGRDYDVQDWSHASSAHMARDGSVLVSFRHLNQIVSVAPDFRSVQWRLGGPGGDFRFPDPSDKFYRQHTAVPLDNGNVLLFDNGNRRPGDEGGQYSRALELQMDMKTMTAKKVWGYRHDPDIFAACCSSVERLENGNTLLVFGIQPGKPCCRSFFIIETDPTGKVVWEVDHVSPGKLRQYRVYPGDSVLGEEVLSVPPPTPLTARAKILEDNSLIALIEGTVDAQGHVYAEYWADDVGRVRSKAVPTEGTRYAVHAVRLRGSTEYSYKVFGTNLQGDIADGPTGAFVTGELPDVLNKATFDVLTGKPTKDLTLMEYRQEDFSGIVAIDAGGHIVWYYSSPHPDQHPHAMTRKSNGNIVFIAAHEPTTAHGIVEINPLGEEVDRLMDICPPDGPIHHEVHLLSDTKVMYLSRSVSRPGFGDPPIPQEGDTIGIWDQTSEENSIVWNIFDFISPRERTEPVSSRTLPAHEVWGGCGRDDSVHDWSHGNSLSLAPDGSVLVSFRHLNQVVSIAPDFQSIQWRLGGPGGDFAFLDPNDIFYLQHTAVALPNNRVLLFDNGNRRPNEEGGQYSRALELELHMGSMTARKVWEFRHDPDIYAFCCSSADRLENGNTLMVFGVNHAPECCRPFNIVEADPEGNVVWEVEHFSPGKIAQYRVYPSDSIMGEVQVSQGE